MQKKTLLSTVVLLFLTGTVCADFFDDFKAAAKLHKERKYQAAAASYKKLAKQQKKQILLKFVIFMP